MALHDFDITEITEKLVTSFEEISLNDEFVNCIVEFFKKNPDLPPTEENIFKHFSIFESSLTQEVFDKVIQKLQPEAKDEKLVKWSDLLMGQFWRSTISNLAN